MHGQMPGGAGPAGVSSALTKLFGKTTAFSAKGEMQVTDTTGHEVAFWPMDFSLLDKKIRVEIDLPRPVIKTFLPERQPALNRP